MLDKEHCAYYTRRDGGACCPSPKALIVNNAKRLKS